MQFFPAVAFVSMDIRKQICELSSSSQFDGKVANDLALLKADGRFAPLPIAASRTGLLGGCWSSSFSLSGRGNTLKRELQRGFPDIGFNAKAQSRQDSKANTVCFLHPGTFASLR
jgi:hypothetical protein